MWRQNKTTAPTSCPGALEDILLNRYSPEEMNTNLLLDNEQPDPDSQGLDLEYLPYYRTSHICPASHICTEREKSSNEGKANTKQDEKSILPSLELNKRVFYSASKDDPPAQQLLGASSLPSSLPTASFPSGHPEQPLPSSGYFPFYRTEEGICTSPPLSCTRTEALEAKEGGQKGGSSVWNLRASCLVS